MQVRGKKSLVGLSYSMDVGGAERMMLTILNECVLDDFEVHLIIFNHKGELLNELSSQIVIHDLEKSSVGKGMMKCLKTLKRIKPDIIFSGIGHLNIALAPFIPLMKFILPKSKWVARETNIVSLQNKVSKFPKLFDFLYRNFYTKYDTIVAQSLDMKEDLLKNYLKTDNVVLINNPIDDVKVTELAKCEPTKPFDSKKVNLLSVSRLRQQKRLDLMLETLTYLPLEYHLTIIGSGEEGASLKTLVEQLNIENRVTFLGHQSNPYSYMQRADFLLLTSEREGFPNVLLEGNCLGLPIVAFNALGGISEIITEGENGFFVPFGECKALAVKIQESNEIVFDQNQIREMTLKKYSKSIILNKYKNIFLY